MADASLRLTERSALQGDTEAATRWLRERVRAGEVTEETLALLAYVGHEPARVLVPYQIHADGVPGLPVARADALPLADWAQGLSRWGTTVCVRAALAAARVALPVWAKRLPEPGLSNAWRTARDAIRAVERYLAEPTEENLLRAHEACAGAESFAYFSPFLPVPFGMDATFGQTPSCFVSAAQALGPNGEQLVRSSIRDHLVRWALGDDTP